MEEQEESDDEELAPGNDPIAEATTAGARFQVPESAAISRKRKINVNGGKHQQRRLACLDATVVKSKTCAWDRLKDFPKQHFDVVEGILRCNACGEILSLKKSSIEKHVKSRKHLNGVESIAKSKKENQSIVQCLKKQDKRNISGSTLPEEMRVFRFELTESFLSAGIPLSKIDDLRPFLEKP